MACIEDALLLLAASNAKPAAPAAAAAPSAQPAAAAAPSSKVRSVVLAEATALHKTAAAALTPLPGVASAIGPVDAACGALRVEMAFAPKRDPETRRATLSGSVVITNTGAFVAAIERAGVRLCGREAGMHLRVEAACDDYDVPAGGSVRCSWALALPAPPAAGARVSAWTGVFSSAALVLNGERCPSAVYSPTTGQPGGTCTAG